MTYRMFLFLHTVKMFPRYAGNHQHVFFHLAGVSYALRGTLLEYVKNFCPVTNTLRQALCTDLQNESILEQL